MRSPCRACDFNWTVSAGGGGDWGNAASGAATSVVRGDCQLERSLVVDSRARTLTAVAHGLVSDTWVHAEIALRPGALFLLDGTGPSSLALAGVRLTLWQQRHSRLDHNSTKGTNASAAANLTNVTNTTLNGPLIQIDGANSILVLADIVFELPRHGSNTNVVAIASSVSPLVKFIF